MNPFPPFTATNLQELLVQLNAASEAWDSHRTEFDDVFGRVSRIRKVTRTPSSATDVLADDRENDFTWDGDNFYFLTDVSGTLTWRSIPTSFVFGSNGILYVNTTQVGNVGTGEDDLMTYTLPGGTLANDGDSLIVEAWGDYDSTLASKTLKFYLGSTAITLFDSTSTITKWQFTAHIIRVGATSQRISYRYHRSSSLNNDIGDITTASETLANDMTIKFTGESTTDDYVLQYAMKIRYDRYGG